MGSLKSKENLSSIELEYFNDVIMNLHMSFGLSHTKRSTVVKISILNDVEICDAIVIFGESQAGTRVDDDNFIRSVANEILGECTTVFGKTSLNLFDVRKKKEFLSKWGKIIFFNYMKSFRLSEKLSCEDSVQVIEELYSSSVVEG